VIAYVVPWALFAFQRMIVWEIPFMAARFVWFRAAVSLPFPFLAAAIAMVIREAVRAARRHQAASARGQSLRDESGAPSMLYRYFSSHPNLSPLPQ
jgi:hypothetical protein